MLWKHHLISQLVRIEDVKIIYTLAHARNFIIKDQVTIFSDVKRNSQETSKLILAQYFGYESFPEFRNVRKAGLNQILPSNSG